MCRIRTGVRSRAATPITPSPTAISEPRPDVAYPQLATVYRRCVTGSSISTMAWRTAMPSANADNTASSTVSIVVARARRSLQRRTVVNIPQRAGGCGSGSPSTASIRCTAYTSEPRNTNTEAMPLCDAMPASCAFMASNTAPVVSVRR